MSIFMLFKIQKCQQTSTLGILGLYAPAKAALYIGEIYDILNSMKQNLRSQQIAMNYLHKRHFFNRNELKDAFKKTLPVMAGYLFLGFAFGLLMRTVGYPTWCPILMSIIIYSGALEFAAVSLLSSAVNPIGSFLFGLMLSARHLFYGIPMLKKYQNTGTAKPFLIFGLTDETFSLLTEPNECLENAKAYYLYITVLNYLYWNVGTIVGTLLGGIIKINLSGLDFALNALFIVLFLEQIKSKRGKTSGAIGIAASVIALLVFGKENMVIMAMILILMALLAGRKVFDSEQ